MKVFVFFLFFSLTLADSGIADHCEREKKRERERNKKAVASARKRKRAAICATITSLPYLHCSHR